MKKKGWLVIVLGVLVGGMVLFGGINSSVSDDDFYVIAAGNRNVKTDATNTAVGVDALKSNTSGHYNTASGASALYSNTSGYYNTASGYGALYSNTTGYYNTASGVDALRSNTTGANNAAFGIKALYQGNGSHNTAIGPWALYNNSTGWDNVALGLNAGFNGDAYDNFTGSNNIYIGTHARPASLTESNTIRIGNKDNPQTQTFIAGIAGTNIGSGSYVFVNSSGRLGIISSSRRHKENIKDMGDASAGLMQLRPVTFYYKPHYANGEHTLQYGLIAEEVAKVYPNLVQYDKTGKPQTVYYHLINTMLLNEFQKQHRRLQAQAQELKTLRDTLSKQSKELAALKKQQRLSAEQNRELLARLAQLEGQVKKVATGSEPAGHRQARLAKLELR